MADSDGERQSAAEKLKKAGKQKSTVAPGRRSSRIADGQRAGAGPEGAPEEEIILHESSEEGPSGPEATGRPPDDPGREDLPEIQEEGEDQQEVDILLPRKTWDDPDWDLIPEIDKKKLLKFYKTGRCRDLDLGDLIHMLIYGHESQPHKIPPIPVHFAESKDTRPGKPIINTVVELCQVLIWLAHGIDGITFQTKEGTTPPDITQRIQRNPRTRRYMAYLAETHLMEDTGLVNYLKEAGITPRVSRSTDDNVIRPYEDVEGKDPTRFNKKLKELMTSFDKLEQEFSARYFNPLISSKDLQNDDIPWKDLDILKPIARDPGTDPEGTSGGIKRAREDAQGTGGPEYPGTSEKPPKKKNPGKTTALEGEGDNIELSESDPEDEESTYDDSDEEMEIEGETENSTQEGGTRPGDPLATGEVAPSAPEQQQPENRKAATGNETPFKVPQASLPPTEVPESDDPILPRNFTATPTPNTGTQSLGFAPLIIQDDDDDGVSGPGGAQMMDPTNGQRGGRRSQQSNDRQVLPWIHDPIGNMVSAMSGPGTANSSSFFQSLSNTTNSFLGRWGTEEAAKGSVSIKELADRERRRAAKKIDSRVQRFGEIDSGSYRKFGKDDVLRQRAQTLGPVTTEGKIEQLRKFQSKIDQKTREISAIKWKLVTGKEPKQQIGVNGFTPEQTIIGTPRDDKTIKSLHSHRTDVTPRLVKDSEAQKVADGQAATQRQRESSAEEGEEEALVRSAQEERAWTFDVKEMLKNFPDQHKFLELENSSALTLNLMPLKEPKDSVTDYFLSRVQDETRNFQMPGEDSNTRALPLDQRVPTVMVARDPPDFWRKKRRTGAKNPDGTPVFEKINTTDGEKLTFVLRLGTWIYWRMAGGHNVSEYMISWLLDKYYYMFMPQVEAYEKWTSFILTLAKPGQVINPSALYKVVVVDFDWREELKEGDCTIRDLFRFEDKNSAKKNQDGEKEEEAPIPWGAVFLALSTAPRLKSVKKKSGAGGGNDYYNTISKRIKAGYDDIDSGVLSKPFKFNGAPIRMSVMPFSGSTIAPLEGRNCQRQLAGYQMFVSKYGARMESWSIMSLGTVVYRNKDSAVLGAIQDLVNQFRIDLKHLAGWITVPKAFNEFKAIMSSETGEAYDGYGYTHYARSFFLVDHSPFSISNNGQLHCFLHLIMAMGGSHRSLNASRPKDMSTRLVKAAFMFYAAHDETFETAVVGDVNDLKVAYSRMIENDTSALKYGTGPAKAIECMAKNWQGLFMRSKWGEVQTTVDNALSEQGSAREGTIGRYLNSLDSRSIGFLMDTDFVMSDIEAGQRTARQVVQTNMLNMTLGAQFGLQNVHIQGHSLPGTGKPLIFKAPTDPAMAMIQKSAQKSITEDEASRDAIEKAIAQKMARDIMSQKGK